MKALKGVIWGAALLASSVCGIRAAHAFDAPASLTVAIADNFSPFSFASEVGDAKGAVKDLWDLWSRRTGVPVKILPMEWPKGIEALKAGRVDVLGAVPLGPEDEAMGYSAEPLASIEHHAFYDGEIAGVIDADSLQRYTVGVVAGGNCHRWASQNRAYAVRSYASFPSLIDGFQHGEIHVICAGRVNALRELRLRGMDADVRMSPTLFSGGLHWATRGGDADLYQFVAAGFANISPTEREEIASNWKGGRWRTATAEQVMGRMTLSLLGIVAALVGVLAWAVFLRRRLIVAVQKLHDSELHLAAVLGALAETASVKDLNGHYLAANDALARACGQALGGRLVGLTDYELFERDVADKNRHADAMALERRMSSTVVEPVVLPNGSEKWVETVRVPVRDENDRAIAIVTLCRDLTAQKRMEGTLGQAMERLQTTENRYRDMLNALPVGVFEIDRHGDVVCTNERSWKITGITPERWHSRPWASFIHADDRLPVVGAIRRMMMRREPLEVEFRVVADDGMSVWVRALGLHRAETGGGIISILDIRERRHAEESRLAREAQFRALTELSPDHVVRYDLDARRVYANPSFVAAAGYPQEELLGRRPSETLGGEQIQAYEAKIRSVAEVGCAAVHELVWADREGTVRTADIRLLPERADNGAVVSVIAIGRDVTRLKEIEAELRRKSEHWAAVLANLPGNAFTFRYGSDGVRQVVYSTSGGDLSFYGMSAEEFDACLHPEDRALVFEEIPRALRQCGFSDARFRVSCGDGAQRWLHSRERVRERQGGDMVVDGLVFDVTEEMEAKRQQEQTAEELRSTAQRMGALLDNIPGVTYRKEYTADDSRIVYVSAGGEALFGPSAAERSYQQRLATVWHPDDHAKVLAFDAAIRGGQDNCEIKLRFRHVDGSVHWALAREKVVGRKDGLIVSEGLVIDITEEVEAKRALEENAEELWRMAGSLRTLLNNLPGVVYRAEYTADGGKKILEHYGEPLCDGADVHTAEGFRTIIHSDDLDAVFRQLPERLRAEGSGELTFRMLAGDGQVKWVYTRERQVELHGSTMVVEGQAYDVTAEVVVRHELEESERRRQRAEARLQQGRRFEALGQFAGGIAHDFNNLLGAMLGYARFIEEDTLADSENHRHASRIIAAGNKGRAIVNQILNYSRRMELNVSRFTLGELVAEVSDFCAAECPGAVAFDIAATFASVELRADRTQLGRVLLNLCFNARDAIVGGTGRITLAAHGNDLDPEALRRLAEREDGEDAGDVEVWTDRQGYAWVVAGRLPKETPYMAISVSDAGLGMDANLLEQAFAPFFTTKDRSRGAGLGLSVVHGIVVAHGGALIGRSRLGEGTRFEVIVPVESMQLSLPAAEPPVLADVQAEGLRVLLVEDNADVLDAVREALRRADYSVDAFADPLGALEAFRAAPGRWGLMVTDQIMPRLRGLDLIRAVRELRPDMPCLLCSGYAEELSEADCLAAGVSEMLRKPVGLRDLMRAIDRVVAQAQNAA